MCEDAPITIDRTSLLAAIAAYDRARAELHRAIGEFDAGGLWELDGATSMKAWLKTEARMSARAANAMVSTASRLRALPVTARAWAEGTLSGGQVDAVMATVRTKNVEAFAADEAELVPTLAELGVNDTATAMRHWKNALDEPIDDEPERHVHLSRTFGDVYELTGTLDAEGGVIVANALRVADDGDREKTRSQRQADALVAVCQWFLDHYEANAPGRHRPHVSLIVDLQALTGRVLDGPALSAAAIRTILCDAGVSRVVTDGPSTVLDYGRTQRTAPQAQFNALAVRDGGCRFPGCDREIGWTHAHHIWEWEDGGPTDLDNMVLLCARHHGMVHKHNWPAKLEPDGTFHVTLSDGRHLMSRAPPGPAHRLVA